MALYTIEDTQTGNRITFDWQDETPPTEADMEQIFAEARQWPQEKTGVSEPSPAPEGAETGPGDPNETAKTLIRKYMGDPKGMYNAVNDPAFPGLPVEYKREVVRLIAKPGVAQEAGVQREGVAALGELLLTMLASGGSGMGQGLTYTTRGLHLGPTMGPRGARELTEMGLRHTPWGAKVTVAPAIRAGEIAGKTIIGAGKLAAKTPKIADTILRNTGKLSLTPFKALFKKAGEPIPAWLNSSTAERVAGLFGAKGGFNLLKWLFKGPQKISSTGRPALSPGEEAARRME